MTIFKFAGGVVVNLFVLLGFVAIWALVRGWSARRQRAVDSWRTGILFGGMAVVSMLVPVAAHPGMIFDCRSGVIGAAALLAGPAAALASLPLPIIYRLYLGGGGTLPGLLEIFFPAVLGSLCHLWFKRRGETLTLRRILFASLFVGMLSNSVIVSLIRIFMPQEILQLGGAGILLVIFNTPVSMAVLSSLIVLEQTHFEAVATIADSERRVLHSQKMAALGHLLRKIAHTYVNALTAIMGNAQLAKSSAPDNAQVGRLMDEVVQTVDRVSRLSGELLAFSSPRPLNLRNMDLGKCVVGIRAMIDEALGPQIEVEINTDHAVGHVNVDPDRIEQAIMHMVVNAAEAMSAEGRLTISVSTANLSEKELDRLQAGVHEDARHQGQFAVLSIQDTGCGMSKETALRVFEPFFTTKPDKENTGLGLATVYSIVQQHGGFIDVKPRPGQGSTFLVYLPIAEEPRP